MTGDPRPAPDPRENELVRRALELPSADRAAFLDEACANDSSLRRRVDDLLKSHAAPDSSRSLSPATTPSSQSAPASSDTDLIPGIGRPGDRIGRYKLLQQIGEGGWGVVYMAEQLEPVRRRVALKVIKLGMDTRNVIARFDAERQALAMMDHPNIARVFDAGATETGRPYFVMELVRGVRITEYCDENRISMRERIELFIQTCQAIQHAHQKGIIHRDIKPTNILITLHDGVPVPKVIDFGIAKATDHRLTEKTLFTEFQSFIGTPAYTSPEQAEMSGIDIDTRSDIYALGVLLYELLTGQTPFDPGRLIQSGLNEMRRIIREEEPRRPSVCLGTLGMADATALTDRRQTRIPLLVQAIRGDLDWIVMKCLEKDRTRRYPTANDLAEDLRRYLRNEPVSACPPAASYRLRKFIRRNKVMVGAATVSVTALLVASVVSTWQAVRATRAEREQIRLRQTAEEAGNQATLQRRLAEAEKLDALHRAYNSEMNLVQQAMQANNYGRVVQLLNRHVPAAGEPDFRQWEWRHFWSRSRSEAAFALPRQSNSITALAVSPNGRLLASRDRDGALKLWDLQNRTEVAVLNDAGQSGWPGSAPFTWSRDGTRLATIASQGPRRSTVKVWTVSNREVAAEFPHDGRIEALAFSADDSRLLTLDSRLTLRGFDLEHRRLDFQHSMTNTADESPGRFRRERRETVFSPDGSLVAVGDSTRGIRLFEVLTGNQWSHIPTNDAAVASMTFSPDGELLAVSPFFTAASTSIQLYSARTGEDMGTLDGHVSWVPALTFMPDGRRLVSAGADQSVRLWDVTTRRELAVFRGHLNEVNCVTLTQDGTTILSGCKDGRLLGWDADNPGRNPPFTLLPVPVSKVEFFPDGQTFLTVDRDGFVTVWDSTTLRERERLPGAASPVNRVLVSNDGSRVFIGTRESGLQVLDWATRLVITNLSASGPNATPIGLVHEGRTLVVSSGRGTIGLWDTLSWKPIAAWQLDEDGSPIPAPIPSATAGRPTSPAAAFRFFRSRASMALSPDGLSILIPIDDGGVEVRDLRSGELRFTVSAHLWDVSSLAWAPDGNMFASASADGMVNLYDPASGEVLDVLRGHLLGVHAIAFSPDGRRLASSSHGSEAVKLWDVTTRHEVATLAGNNAVFSQVGFSPDGELLIAVNASAEAHVWRAPTTTP